MELRFVQPSLRRLDLLVSEVIAVPIEEMVRPPRGSAGLLDYRLDGRISAVLENGTFRGAVGEKLLLSGKPKLPYDKLLLYGMGDAQSFNQHIFAGLVEDLLESLADLGVRRAVVELPGRLKELIEPEVAAEILLTRAGENPLFDTWTLVDSAAAQRVVTELLRRDRRSEWRVS